MKLSSIMSMVLAISLGIGEVALAQNAAPTAPNNTGVNVRDRDASAVTADQQANTKGDREMARQIRHAVEKDDSLSTMAHNVKIISDNGIVTLRGPVKSAEEKATITDKARAIAGAGNVHDQLEVETR